MEAHVPGDPKLSGTVGIARTPEQLRGAVGAVIAPIDLFPAHHAAVPSQPSGPRTMRGHSADFFGAMDSSFDTRYPETAGFHGPFAKLSIGLGG